jgi:hypothetical protein
MPVTRYRQGGTTVTLTGDLEAFARRAVDAAGGESVRILEGGANTVRTSAASEWYRRVERETGKSGTLDVITTIDVSRGQVRVSLGSTDDRVAGKTGKPVPVFVRAPAADSLVLKVVDHKTYWETPENLRGKYPKIKVRNPLAVASPKFLLQELVKAPFKREIKRLTPELGRAIAARINGGARG